jgi:hypothetical protein
MLYADSWMTTLPVMGAGMLGIFVVIGAIIGVVYLLAKLTQKK